MNILGIASILPIPGLKAENDVILRLYAEIQSLHENVRFRLMKPSAFPFPMRSLLEGKWSRYLKLQKEGRYSVDGFSIELLPGIIFKSPSWLKRYQIETIYWLNRKKLMRWVEDNKPNIIHANYGNSDGYIALKLHKACGVPYVVTLRNEISFFFNRSFANIMKEVINHAYGVTTPSFEMASFLRPICGDRLDMVPHGIEAEFVVESEERISGKNRLLSVCRLLKLKNIDKILIALSRLKERYSFHYTLIGDGPERERILADVERLGLQGCFTHISHVPYEEMPRVYAEHDVFLLCSYPETFGRVYFEAMAAGLPMLCANKHAINGYFEEGVSGFSVNPGDLNKITEKIEFFLKEPKRTHRMGENARNLVKNYTWPSIARRYIRNWGIDRMKWSPKTGQGA